MSVPVWILFFLPGVSAALTSATPWLVALAVLWCIGWLAVRFGCWVMDDTWKIRRDTARRLALDAELQIATRMPTSRRALTASRQKVAP